MKKIMFFNIMFFNIMLLLAACASDDQPLQVAFITESLDCQVDQTNLVTTLTAELQVIQGTNPEQLGFRVSAFSSTGDNLPIKRVALTGFSQFWEIDETGSTYFLLDGVSQVGVQVFFVSELPAEMEFTVVVELIDQLGTQLSAVQFICFSNEIDTNETDSCENCTTRLSHQVTERIINEQGLSFSSLFSAYDECPIRFELSVTGQVIEGWQVSGGTAQWSPWTYDTPSDNEFTVFIPASQLAQGINQITWRIYSSAGTLIDGQSFSIEYGNSSGSNDCRLISHRLSNISVSGTTIVLKTSMGTSSCLPAKQIYLDIVEVLSSTLDIQSVSITTPGAPGANFNSNGPWSIQVPNGVAEFTVTLRVASVQSGAIVAFNLSDYDHDIIVQAQGVVPGLSVV